MTLEEMTREAKRMWKAGEITKRDSNFLDSVVEERIIKDKGKKLYSEWMSRSANKSSDPEKIIAFHDFCFNKVNIPKTAEILDVGVRDGMGLKLLSNRGFSKLHGIELCNVEMKVDLPLKIKSGDIHNTDYDSESFDAIFCREVLEHCYDPKLVLKELYRTLKPDGVVFMSLPSQIAVSWHNCKRITIESFINNVHEVGFIFSWIEMEEKKILTNEVTSTNIQTILRKF